MVSQKKQGSTDSIDEQELKSIQKEIQKLSKITTKLQTNQKAMSKALKEINKKIKDLVNTAKDNKENIELINSTSEKESQQESLLFSNGSKEDHAVITRETFVAAIKTILQDLKSFNPKGYVDIKSVKSEFMKRFYLADGANFDHWLLEAYWTNEIELISGISDYSVRDIYDNVYHHIRY